MIEEECHSYSDKVLADSLLIGGFFRRQVCLFGFFLMTNRDVDLGEQCCHNFFSFYNLIFTREIFCGHFGSEETED